jgi:predicted phosphodiesterase
LLPEARVRIAILSDIHGNLLALEAVLADIDSQSPDQIWCGGDVALFGPWASECIERVRAAGWPTVRGNTDIWITGDPQAASSDDLRREILALAEAHAISDSDVEWLLGLPLGHSGPGSILLVHATPQSPFDAPMPNAPAADFAPYQNSANIVVYGHVHRAFVRRLAAGTLVANPGSVGLPMDSELASYLLVDQDGPEFVLRHRRVVFDRAAAAAEARRLGGPIGARFGAAMEGA